ncbi:MAG TPA: CTP synthase [Nanoarchaeota archaeon]|nr:CTP synthase [Candidatus Pacearchaeota archaeon]HIH17541.1 CTP synthase [Nanoarchaeota archaeon]HIH34515.1 CTP synthase [Nanoarchaeota archaeon]HIH51512.1 CTP synthase [Nanoarchaeota archaeon]HIH66444.1 CTP synthase [Nanoarchaeota archaeon]
MKHRLRSAKLSRVRGRARKAAKIRGKEKKTHSKAVSSKSSHKSSRIANKFPPVKKARYLFVTGSMSGLGKGLVTASIAKLLQSQGFNVSIAKIDPYINVDAGTMSPFEHGEVFVTADGYEGDQDLGTYERFLDKNLNRAHNITTGRIFSQVIAKEREGKYLGKTVQPIPHITDEIKDALHSIAQRENADFVVVEIGGTVGDIENQLFLEAAKQIAFEEPAKFVHVVYIPELTLKEQKTKMAQHSVRSLQSAGIDPNFLIARSENPLGEEARRKLALFCNVKYSNIISSHNVGDTYKMPLVFIEQNFDKLILEEFGLKNGRANLDSWRRAVERKERAQKKITIGIVGKYSRLQDSYVSIVHALRHCEHTLGIRINVEWIDSERLEEGLMLDNTQIDGLIVPGGFGNRGVEGKICAIRYARENGIPFLGLCLGFQLAAIEYARDVLGLKDANSTEFTKTKNPIIYLLPGQDLNKLGATMRLGNCPFTIKKKSLTHKIYGKLLMGERHRHRYEFDNRYKKRFEAGGMIFGGISADKLRLAETLELPQDKHPFFFATQYHAEFTSRFERPSPVFLAFAKAAAEKA